jgi:hypothetical protein
MTLGGIAAFGLVWAGLATNIAKIARRESNPPSFSLVLNSAHLGRFASWALVGAATLPQDFWTGVLLLTTRVPAVALLAVTFVQRSQLRPSRAQLSRVLVPLVGSLLIASAVIAWLQPQLPLVSSSSDSSALPPATLLQYVLNALVVACFAVQVCYALPRQIVQAVAKPLGNLRWFQLGLLANYAYTFVYASFVQDALVGVVMRNAYALVFAEQLVLVAIIESGIQRRRRSRAEAARG